MTGGRWLRSEMSFSVAERNAGLPPRPMPGREIIKQLLDFLLSGGVAPGSRIPSERQLAEGLGVGRMMIREAVKSLSLLGLLEQRVGDGTYLSRSSSDLPPGDRMGAHARRKAF